MRACESIASQTKQISVPAVIDEITHLILTVLLYKQTFPFQGRAELSVVTLIQFFPLLSQIAHSFILGLDPVTLPHWPLID